MGLANRAIIVAIEHTGQIPEEFPIPLPLSPEEREKIKPLVNISMNTGLSLYYKQLFLNYYEPANIKILAGTFDNNADAPCTKENIRDGLRQLGKDRIVDLAFFGHGGESSPGNGDAILVLADGLADWSTNLKNLTKTDVLGWKNLPGFQDLKLGLVYMMNCYGGQFNDAWIKLGFKTAIGPLGGNYMPEGMFTTFWTFYLNNLIMTPRNVASMSWSIWKPFWKNAFTKILHYSNDEAQNFIASSEPIVSSKRSLRKRFHA